MLHIVQEEFNVMTNFVPVQNMSIDLLALSQLNLATYDNR
jgi:hypothetical protein